MVSEEEDSNAVEEKKQQQSYPLNRGEQVVSQAASAPQNDKGSDKKRAFASSSSTNNVPSGRSRPAHGFSSAGHESPPPPNQADRPPPSPLVTPPMASHHAPTSPDSRGVGPASSPGTSPGSADANARPGNNPGSSKHVNKRLVPHVYHDYSQVPDVPGYVRKKTGGVTQPFPDKLHEMLSQEEGDHSDVVAWLPHGRAFIVRKPKEFTANIMPKYFRQSKLTSFQRQLNLYGFRRITQGVDSGAYYHELFLRGRPALSLRMVRQKVKGTGHKQPADTSTEPNFYNMPPMSPGMGSTSTGGGSYTPLSATSPQVSPGGTQLSPGGSRVYSTNSRAYTAMMASAGAPEQPPMSPGMQGLHGAAHLLRGISSGMPVSELPPTPFLGQAAAAGSPGEQQPIMAYSASGGRAARAAASSATTTNQDEARVSLKPQPASFLSDPRAAARWKEQV